MSTNIENRAMAIYAQNALIRSQMTTGQIAGMTDADELISQSNTNAAAVHFDERRAIQRDTNDNGIWKQAIDAGILTDANVAAANTVAGVTAIFTALNSEVVAGANTGTYWNA
jgi:hypothetical protein